jgi:hypothetical protein
MARLCVTVPVELHTPPWNHRYLDSDGNTCTWLHVGPEGELGLYGTLDAMRRLGEAVLAAATEPDPPGTEHEHRGRQLRDDPSRRPGGDTP